MFLTEIWNLVSNFLSLSAARSYHCHKCGRCVLKMNHHCAWLNVCIGHYNQSQYLMYLSSSLASALLSVITLYQGLQRSHKPSVHFFHFVTLLFRYYGQWDEDKQYPSKDMVVISTPELWNFNFCLGLSFGLTLILTYFLIRQVGMKFFFLTLKTIFNYRSRNSFISCWCRLRAS